MSAGRVRAWKLTLGYRNTPDNTWSVVNPTMYFMWAGGTAGKDDRYLGEVADGETVAMTTTLLPGTHTVTEIHPDLSKTQLGTIFAGGACGNQEVPRGDPSGLGGSAGDSGKPSARVTKCTAKKCFVELDNRGVSSATTFQVVTKPRGKKAVKRDYTVQKDRAQTVKVKAPKVKKVTVKTSGKRVLKQKFPARCQTAPIVPKAYSKACYARIA